MSAAIAVRVLEDSPDGGDVARCKTPGCGRAAEWQVHTDLPHGASWDRDTCTSHVLGSVALGLADLGEEL